MGIYSITVSLFVLTGRPCANNRTTEFRRFVQETEKELFALFKSIDHNHDNKLTKDELQAAFRTSLHLQVCRHLQDGATSHLSG